MNYKTKIYWILTVSVITSLISLILALPENFGLCSKNDIVCLHNYIDNFNEIIQVIFIFSIPIIIVSFILLFLREQVFNTWLKFSIIFLLIAIVLIAMAPTVNGTLIGFDKETTTLWLATIFMIVSLLIVVIKSLHLRRERK